MKKLTHAEISINRATTETVGYIRKVPVVVILDNIRSAYNVGSVFRTSDGAMIEKLYLTGFTPTPEKPEVKKTALGSTESVAWEYAADARELLTRLRSEGYTIAALELAEQSIPHYAVQPAQFPLALVIGNEISGVQQSLLDECSLAIEIPQYGIKQSLNVAVAYGITIFELRRVFETLDSL